jgi:hypothetical protein
LQCLGLVSQHLKGFSDRVRFKKIVLEDDEEHERDSFEIIELLTDYHHPLSQCVRDLRIKSFKGDEASSYMDVKLISDCLVNTQKLDSFRSAMSSISHAFLGYPETAGRLGTSYIY